MNGIRVCSIAFDPKQEVRIHQDRFQRHADAILKCISATLCRAYQAQQFIEFAPRDRTAISAVCQRFYDAMSAFLRVLGANEDALVLRRGLRRSLLTRSVNLDVFEIRRILQNGVISNVGFNLVAARGDVYTRRLEAAIRAREATKQAASSFFKS